MDSSQSESEEPEAKTGRGRKRKSEDTPASEKKAKKGKAKKGGNLHFEKFRIWIHSKTFAGEEEEEPETTFSDYDSAGGSSEPLRKNKGKDSPVWCLFIMTHLQSILCAPIFRRRKALQYQANNRMQSAQPWPLGCRQASREGFVHHHLSFIFQDFLWPKSNFQRCSVSCVADTSTQREVVVECFAPYDDHRWVNIGKVRKTLLFSRSIGAHNSLKGAGSDGPWCSPVCQGPQTSIPPPLLPQVYLIKRFNIVMLGQFCTLVMFSQCSLSQD